MRDAEFTPGKAKGIDYMFAGGDRRLKKTVTAPVSSEAPSSEYANASLHLTYCIA